MQGPERVQLNRKELADDIDGPDLEIKSEVAEVKL